MYRRSYGQKAEGVESDAPVAPQRDEDGFDVYLVHCSPHPASTRYGNALDLTGEAQLALGPVGQVRLRGSTRRPLFGESQEVDLWLEPEQVVNVLADGKSVRFEVAADEGERAHASLWLPNAATAAAIAARLPQTRTADFDQSASNLADFHAALER